MIDSSNMVIYIGKAQNILNRWKTHHRRRQIEEHHQHTQVKIAWLAWNVEDLEIAEKYFINYYHPEFNGTTVQSIKNIPSELTLKKLLGEIRLLVVATGIQNDFNQLPTVYLKYNYENSGKNSCTQKIKGFWKEHKDKDINLKIKRKSYGKYTSYNTRPGSREHKQISRIQSSYNNHWEIACNGVIIDITPTGELHFKLMRDRAHSTWRKLAGVKIRAVNNPTANEPSLMPLIKDPIPLFWNESNSLK